MTRRTLRTLAVLATVGTAAGLGGCTIYDTGPAYPYGYSYGEPGYYAAPPPAYYGPDLYLGFGTGYGGHSYHRRGHWHHRR